MAKPEAYDAKIAGWWVWGSCCWIGSGFCSGNGPWWINDEGQLVHLGDNGQGVNRKLVHLGSNGQGVNRKRVHLGNNGRGVNRKRVHLGDNGRGVNRKRVHLGNNGRGVTVEIGYLTFRVVSYAPIALFEAAIQRITRLNNGRKVNSDTVSIPPPVATGVSVAYDLWRPGPNDDCTAEIHNSYSVVGPDGKLYFGINADRDAMSDVDVLPALLARGSGHIAFARNVGCRQVDVHYPAASASAGMVSVTRLSQRICNAVNGSASTSNATTPSPSRAARTGP